MDAAGTIVVVLLLAALALVGAFAFRWSRRRAGRYVLVAAILLTVLVLGLDYAAFATDFREADGVLDCWPSCSPTQDAIRWSAFIGAPLLVVLVAALLARIAVDRTRRSDNRPRR